MLHLDKLNFTTVGSSQNLLEWWYSCSHTFLIKLASTCKWPIQRMLIAVGSNALDISKVVWNFQVHWNAHDIKGLIEIEWLLKALPAWQYGRVIDIGNTLNFKFSVTYYLKVCNVICIYYISHVLPTNVKLVVWTI